MIFCFLETPMVQPFASRHAGVSPSCNLPPTFPRVQRGRAAAQPSYWLIMGSKWYKWIVQMMFKHVLKWFLWMVPDGSIIFVYRWLIFTVVSLSLTITLILVFGIYFFFAYLILYWSYDHRSWRIWIACRGRIWILRCRLWQDAGLCDAAKAHTLYCSHYIMSDLENARCWWLKSWYVLLYQGLGMFRVHLLMAIIDINKFTFRMDTMTSCVHFSLGARFTGSRAGSWSFRLCRFNTRVGLGKTSDTSRPECPQTPRWRAQIGWRMRLELGRLAHYGPYRIP